MAAAKQASVPAQPALVPIQPQVIKSVGAASAQVPVVAPSGPAVAPPPPENEWDDDDDEPTLQTLSPPVKALSKGGSLEGPKPVRRPEEVVRPEADERAAQEQAAQEKAAQERAAQEKAAQEQAAQEKAAQEQAAQERAAQEKAAQEKAAQEKAAQETTAGQRAMAERAAAEPPAAQERTAAERAAQERAAQVAAERTAQEKATLELVRIREQRAAQERQARERADAEALRAKSPVGPRRISTPTSVDAVDVEITTQHSGSKPGPIAIDLDADGIENTVSVSGDSKDPGPAKSQRPVQPSPAAAPEKERPRVDPAASIDAFVAMAVAARASDLHIVAGRPALLRIATDLLPRTQAIPAEQVERIAKEIVPPRLREVLDRDGACDFAIEHPAHGRFRVNASVHRTGFKLSLRIIPKEIPTLAALGLPEAVANVLRHQRGLVLVTGEASQGKSTTLAAMIDHLNRETARHIVTIEEPLEHVHARKKSLVSQREVGLHTREKARAIQGTLREDSDVVAIGEVNDAESLRLALDVAESGRLVLATMNAPSAQKAIDRILQRFPAPERTKIRATLAGALRLVIGQRLVPSADRTRLHVAVELFPWSVALYILVRDGRLDEIPALGQRGAALGLVRIDESLAELVRAQKITAEVARHYADVASDFDNPPARAVAAAGGPHPHPGRK